MSTASSSLDVLIKPLTFHFIAEIAGMLAVRAGSQCCSRSAWI